MSVKVAITGFGRIGRDVLRGWCLSDKHDFEITHIASRNASQRIDTYAHLFEYDSIYRRYPGEVKVVEGGFTVDGKMLNVIDGKLPAEMNWAELGIDVVIESTGAFNKRELAEGHLKAGAKKVILTAPGKDEDITIVMGVNDHKYDSSVHNIISNASCTTNCLAPLTKVILENFGIEKGLMTTVHAYTNDQRIHDGPHKKDMRRARMAAENMVPTTTGAAKAVALVLPELKGKMTGMAVRVPVPTGSMVDVVYEISKDASLEEINAAVKKAAENELKGILEYQENDLVSSDIVQSPYSSIFDAKLTTVQDRLVKCISWYDNEWGYAQRVLDLTDKVAGLL